MLPDLDALRVEAADADAEPTRPAQQLAPSTRTAAAAADRRAAEAAAAAFDGARPGRQEYEALVIEGRGAAAELDAAGQQVVEQEAELAGARLAALAGWPRPHRAAAGLADGRAATGGAGAGLAAAGARSTPSSGPSRRRPTRPPLERPGAAAEAARDPRLGGCPG